jgi:hypothetical protein
MPYYRSEKLGVYHMRGRNLPKPCGERIVVNGKEVTCLFPSDYLCDGPGAGARTCDRPLCGAHATQTGPNKHLCPACRTAAADASGQRSLFTHLVQP